MYPVRHRAISSVAHAFRGRMQGLLSVSLLWGPLQQPHQSPQTPISLPRISRAGQVAPEEMSGKQPASRPF